MIVLTFYTADGLYDREVERLKASADRVGLLVDAVQIDDAGNWNANVARKVDVIRNTMRMNPSVPVLFVDADAVFHANPQKLFGGIYTLGYDFAARWRINRMQSGTMWFSGSGESFALVTRWRIERDRLIKVGHMHGHGQRTLQAILERSDCQVKTFDLPTDLCYVFDNEKMNGHSRPIIEHMQASREADGAAHSKAQRASRAKRIAEIDADLAECIKDYPNGADENA